MGTNTANHAFYKPTDGEDGWATSKNADWDDLDTKLIQKETEANRPAAGTEGRWFLATDTKVIYYDNGASWDVVTGSTISDDGTEVLDAFTDINFTTDLAVTDDGDGTVTVAFDGTYYTDADALNAVNNDGDHGSTASHDYYTDGDAISAINSDTDHGDTASHSYFSGSHTDLTNLSADDHHAKYTDADAQAAINADADHGSTASHDYFSGSHGDLSDIGASDHHAKYTNAEAVTAVENEDPLQLTGNVNMETAASGDAGFTFEASDGSTEIEFVYDESIDRTILKVNDPGSVASEYISINHATENGPHFPHGLSASDTGGNAGIEIGGNKAVYSSDGQYDIQVDGTDGAGIINFKTS